MNSQLSACSALFLMVLTPKKPGLKHAQSSTLRLTERCSRKDQGRERSFTKLTPSKKEPLPFP